MYVGLGQTIPWQCWNSAGFKACHAVQWQAASDKCSTPGARQAYDNDVSRCIEEQTYLLARGACFPLCPQSSSEVVVPMTEQEVEEAGGRPERPSQKWKWYVGAAAAAVAIGVVLHASGVGESRPAHA